MSAPETLAQVQHLLDKKVGDIMRDRKGARRAFETIAHAVAAGALGPQNTHKAILRLFDSAQGDGGEY